MQKSANASKFFALLQGSVFHNVWMKFYAGIVLTGFDIKDTMERGSKSYRDCKNEIYNIRVNLLTNLCLVVLQHRSVPINNKEAIFVVAIFQSRFYFLL